MGDLEFSILFTTFVTMKFELESKYKPAGDQPQAIDQIVSRFDDHAPAVALMGVTGSGKTFTMANVIERLNRPVLVLSHNKTLAAQLYSEFKSFFPRNAVEYFVSYYDYYQPEAYIPTTDTYIEKDLAINAEIDRMRLSATQALLSGRRDVIVVSSVSCIYGIGNPTAFRENTLVLRVGQEMKMNRLLRHLVELLYTRVDTSLQPATFRLMGDTLDICSAIGNNCFRILFFDDEIEAIHIIDPYSGQRISSIKEAHIYPSNLFVPSKSQVEKAIEEIGHDLVKQEAFFEREGRLVEAQRIQRRVSYDLEMIKELGYCSGIENYSRYFDGRRPGMRPFCLLDYFPKDYLLIIDESHVTIPQIRGMYGGDRSRKENLVEYGFRLPAARDNRPLRFEEFSAMQGQTLYVSATPSEYELQLCENQVVEQFIRPTGLVDPAVEVRSADKQIDNLMEDIEVCVKREERVIVTTISKRMCEDVASYLEKAGVRSRYIHSDLDTLERVQILEELKAGMFDVLCGVNLLREGIDLPEVSHVAIFDADKKGFLRDERSLTQISGRAARNINGTVVLYGVVCSDSMAASIEDSNRRREKQVRYNIENGIIPRQIERKDVQSPLLEAQSSGGGGNTAYYVSESAANGMVADVVAKYGNDSISVDNLDERIAEARASMEEAAKRLDFIVAAHHRDRMYELQRLREERCNRL